MEQYDDNLEIFHILKYVKKRENLKMSMMSRQDKIDYIVAQMNAIEMHLPEMVNYCESSKEKEQDKGYEYEK